MIDQPNFLPYIFSAVAVLIWAIFWSPRRELLRDIPLAKGSSKTLIGAKYAFVSGSADIIASGLKKFQRPFQILTPIGPQVIIPHKYIEEIKNHPHMSAAEALTDQMLGHLQGFEVFETMNPYHSIMQLAIRKKVSPAANMVVEELADEAKLIMDDVLGSPEDWTSLGMETASQNMVGRISTRVLLGPELCKNPEWMDIMTRQASETLGALNSLYAFPIFMRPWMNKILPACRKYRQTYKRASQLILDLAAQRRTYYQQLQDQGRPLPKVGDNIIWMDDLSNGKAYDLAGAQLFMSLAGNPTATDVVSNLIYEICTHPQYIKLLRAEIQASMLDGTWDKTFLDKLKFMDSFLREVMRVNPLSVVALQRKATQDITFKDGSTIPKGAPTCVSMDVMFDPQYYPEPHVFNPHRFAEQGRSTSERWVAPDPSYLAFGYGKHSCPGRYLANNEIKVLACYLLTMYDWKFPEGTGKPKTVTTAVIHKKDPTAKVLYKRRSQTKTSA